MTPSFVGSEGGRVAPELGQFLGGDRDVALIHYDSEEVIFVGSHADALAFMDDRGLVLDWHCELVENRNYVVGFEAF